MVCVKMVVILFLGCDGIDVKFFCFCCLELNYDLVNVR